MDHTIDQQIAAAIRNIVQKSETWAAARQRVVASYGEFHVPFAERVARDTQGNGWVDPAVAPSPTVIEPQVIFRESTSPIERIALGSASKKTLIGAWIALLLALAFPPYFAKLTEGMSSNLGFAFIFQPPAQGYLKGLVYLPLLGAELFVILIIGGTAFAWARHNELTESDKARH
jgi:hypothetical protein